MYLLKSNTFCLDFKGQMKVDRVRELRSIPFRADGSKHDLGISNACPMQTVMESEASRLSYPHILIQCDLFVRSTAFQMIGQYLITEVPSPHLRFAQFLTFRSVSVTECLRQKHSPLRLLKLLQICHHDVEYFEDGLLGLFDRNNYSVLTGRTCRNMNSFPVLR
jgi:hypothetical protein